MKIIRLTDEQANLLCVYILMTTKYREEEQKAYEQVAAEFPNNKVLKSNAAWWADTSARLEQIRNIIDRSEREQQG